MNVPRPPAKEDELGGKLEVRYGASRPGSARRKKVSEMTPRRSPAALCMSLLLAAACGGGQRPACEQGPLEVELGTGLDAFVTMPGGADLPFYAGPQGAYHVYGSVRARGYTPAGSTDPSDPDQPMVWYRLRLGDQTIALSATRHLYLAPVGDGWSGRAGSFVIMVVPSPLELDGKAVELEVQVTDRCALVGGDVRGGVLRFAGAGPPPPG